LIVYTQCPHCDTVYPLPPQQLAQAHGRMQCGHCEREFNAVDRLREEDDYASRPQPSSLGPARLDYIPPPEQGDLFKRPSPLPRAPVATPAFVATSPAAPRPWLRWASSALLLALILGLQVIAAQRAELAADPRYRPWLARACATLGCTLPPWREPAALQLLAREIGPHPSVPNALLVTATMRNPGPWPQTWPQLELALADLDGRALGLRRFSPAEYLGGEPQVAALASAETVMLRLELADPGKQAVAFAFEFR